MNPKLIDKYLYITRTPTWLVRLFYAFGLIAWVFVARGFFEAMSVDSFFRWFVAPLVAFFTVYQIFNYGLNLFYRRFDLERHLTRVKDFWKNASEPTVDIFLPVCGENNDVLRNTWTHVSQLDYVNKRIHVLDDSKEGCAEHKRMAAEFGFTYFERPNKGWMKKAGNLRYAYERTNGEFIVIFDADFAPHPDFVKELLPYMADRKVGIVQSPQYFSVDSQTHRRSPLAYGGAYTQEVFYRIIQVVRDRFNATVCCGSNAIYRRSALDEIGGIALNDLGEDLHTGFALTNKGWIVKYIPVILAIGLCPDDAHAYFHQQHRWCITNLDLMFSREFWTSSLSWQAKASYVAGLLYYLHHPLAILFSFQLFWTLFFYNPYITLAGGIAFYPYLIWGFAYMLPFIGIARMRWGVFYASFLQMYSYSHAIMTKLMSGAVGWIPANAKYAGVSTAFRQMFYAVSAYTMVYVGLLIFMAMKGMIHLLNYNYYSVQFWLFYNTILTGLLLWQLSRTLMGAARRHREDLTN